MGKLSHWAATFAVIGLFAAFLGFGEIAGRAAPVARMLFWFSLAIVGVSLAAGAVRRT
jgi:uncharacterized membrane protein YtjA (UPF0391 family)